MESKWTFTWFSYYITNLSIDFIFTNYLVLLGLRSLFHIPWSVIYMLGSKPFRGLGMNSPAIARGWKIVESETDNAYPPRLRPFPRSYAACIPWMVTSKVFTVETEKKGHRRRELKSVPLPLQVTIMLSDPSQPPCQKMAFVAAISSLLKFFILSPRIVIA
jgi:hypothetical protein